MHWSVFWFLYALDLYLFPDQGGTRKKFKRQSGPDSQTEQRKVCGNVETRRYGSVYHPDSYCSFDGRNGFYDLLLGSFDLYKRENEVVLAMLRCNPYDDHFRTHIYVTFAF
jgi:hypothetical protein